MPVIKVYKQNPAILKDIIKCGICECAMTPTHGNKNGRKYRYYACSNHLRMKSCISANKTLPAGEVEEFVSKSVRKILKNPAITSRTIHELEAADITLDNAQESLRNIDKLWGDLHFNEQQKIIKLLIKSVVVHNDGIKILLNPEGAQQLIQEVIT